MDVAVDFSVVLCCSTSQGGEHGFYWLVVPVTQTRNRSLGFSSFHSQMIMMFNVDFIIG